MKQTKHILLMAVLLLCSLAASAHDFVKNGIYYSSNNNDVSDPTVSVTYMGSFAGSYKNEYTGHVSIPSTVTHWGTTYRVNKIDNGAFNGCDKLTSVYIPSSVTSIGNGAFLDCTSLTSITIPEGVTSIGNGAFLDCTSLTSITIPEGVTSIGDHAFEGCSSLVTINIPKDLNLQYVGSEIFKGCVSIAPFVVDNIKLYQAFVSDGLKDKVTYPHEFAFAMYEDGTPYLSKYVGDGRVVLLPEDYKGQKYKIGYGAFSGCSSLTSITIPEGVTSIGNSAFRYCSSLTSITIPEGVTSIGNEAFYGCSSLTSITIPEGVTSIGNHAFINCTKVRLLS